MPAELATFSLAGSAIFDIRDTFFDTGDLDLRRAGQVRQEFGMAGKGETGRVQHRFVDRCGDERGRFACLAGPHAFVDGGGHRGGVGGRRLAGFRFRYAAGIP